MWVCRDLLQMIIDIDIGNSRLKWCLREERRLREDQAAVDSNRVPGRGFCARADFNLQSGIPGLVLPPEEPLKRIRVCNVAGTGMLEELRQWADSCFGLPLEVASVCDGRSGVRCGYQQADSLGVDRWLALLAAWDRLGESCVVVDAGTALTVDVLVAKDRKYNDQTLVEHLGGYIVPGLTMMSDALYTRTDGVRPAPADLATLGPGGDTGAAVQRGCIAMAVALVERVRAQTASQARGASVPLVLTGGDADSLLPFIIEPVQSIPDLVLDGLAIALPGDNSL